MVLLEVTRDGADSKFFLVVSTTSKEFIEKSLQHFILDETIYFCTHEKMSWKVESLAQITTK